MDGAGTRVPWSVWLGPRVRRPSDLVRLGGALAGLGFLVFGALLAPDVATDVADAVPAATAGPVRVLLSIASVAISLGTLGVIVAVLVDAGRSRRPALLTAVLACLAGLVLAALAESLGDAAGGVVAHALTGPRDDAALVPVTAATALLVGADLQRRRRWLAPARYAVLAAAATSVALGSVTVPGAIGALLLAAVVGCGARLAVGVAPARPAEDAVRSALARAGVPLDGLRLAEQSTGRARYVGTDAEGEVCVTVVDPDGRGPSVVRRLGRMVRFRAAVVGRPALTQRGLIERQALSASLAAAAGVAAPAVLAVLSVGPALMLVERPLTGLPLTGAEGPAGAPEGLEAAFRALRRLHDNGLAHGAIGPDTVVLTAEGEAGFTDLGAAQPAAGELQRDLDVVALLAVGALVAGAAGSVAALRSEYSGDPAMQARLGALVRPLALAPPLRRPVRRADVLGPLRAELAVPGGPPGAAPRLERFAIRTILTVAATVVAAFLLATQLSRVSLLDELRDADPWWFGVALVGSAVTYLGAALVLVAFTPSAISLARTTLVQVAASWLTLVTPPTVGHVGLNVRFLQRSGMPVPAAAATVAVSQVATVVVTIALLLVAGWVSGVTTARLSLLPSGQVLLVLVGALLAVAALLAVPPVRRLLHSRLEPFVRHSLPQLLTAATDPRRLGTALLGILVLNAGYVLALDASLRAFAGSVSLPTLAGVYLVASTVGSVAPTPGGLGAVEAALVGGLTAVGVPVATALAAVLAFRTATFWLPAPVGWVAFVHLQRRRHI
ncbi:lysylphosphatidylglycerol synthase domain-containing protein [Trujillonella humicola]|uniref:lysylphosphatidylglycerol synthase domain-containing protein n=1 Tax=Trujillonella humicola TaxID=3383699 RepID=UPI0039069367